MNRKKQQPPEDDGRTLSPMNVEGMPWYTPPAPLAQSGLNPAGGQNDPGEQHQQQYQQPQQPPSRRETAKLIFGAVGAALGIVLIFGAFFALVIALLLAFWNR